MKPQTQIPVEWLAQQLQTVLPAEEIQQLVDSFTHEIPVSLRINPHKYSRGISLEKIPWCGLGFYLPARPSFTHDALFHAGAYYVQEASSMFLMHIAGQLIHKIPAEISPVILDSCAAPGGKTTLLSTLVMNRGVVVANEVIRKRFSILEENTIKWGNGNIIPVNNQVNDFTALRNTFDMLVIDAPCSGEGLWRKDAEAIEEWSEQNVAMCEMRQREIMEALWPALKPGGWMIYSTCTLNMQENEKNIEWFSASFTDAEVEHIEVPAGWNITQTTVNGINCFRFFPHKTKGEGFFISVIKKKGNLQPADNAKAKTNVFKLAPALAGLFAQPQVWVTNTDQHTLAFPETTWQVIQQLSTLKFSVMPFMVKEKSSDLFHPALALRTGLNHTNFQVLELNADEAIQFLMCDTSRLKPAITEKIQYLVTYQSLSLGFIRKIGNSVRIDYNKDWRIRKQGRPDTWLN